MTNLSSIQLILEKLYDDVNKRFFENELEPCIITIQSKGKSNAYGWFSCAKVWKGIDDAYNEINISSEYLTRPIKDIVGTMIHEMVHKYCNQNGIQDTSRGGKYHNKTFKTEAEKRGLTIDYDKRIGHSITSLNDVGIDFVENNKALQDFAIARANLSLEEDKTKKKSNSIKYVCPDCGTSIRATKEVNIMCGDCQTYMLKM